MSTTCTKDYILTVNHGLTVNAYWTFSESGSSSDRVDSVAALHLVPNAQTALTDEPGRFTNGLGFLERGTFSNFITAIVAQLANTGPGFSIFFWFNVSDWPSAANYAVNPFIEMTQLGSSGFFIKWVPDGLGGQLVIQVNDDNHNPFAPAPFRPTLGVWYFVHAFFDPVLTQVGYSINNGSNLYDPTLGATFAPFPNGRLQIGQTWSSGDTTTNAITIDELGFRLDRKLTPTEVAFLYNSGSGRTWPL